MAPSGTSSLWASRRRATSTYGTTYGKRTDARIHNPEEEGAGERLTDGAIGDVLPAGVEEAGHEQRQLQVLHVPHQDVERQGGVGGLGEEEQGGGRDVVAVAKQVERVLLRHLIAREAG
jgi:hypothetical protein